MALTRDFRETIKARADQDPEFRQALALEAIECFLNNDVETGKALIRDYINATLGFEALAEALDTPAKSLMRMFGPKGNPQARSLFPVIAHIRRRERLVA
jgi:hypothetical protein